MFPLKRTLPACLFSQAHVHKERRCKMTQRIVIRNGTVLTGDKERGSFTRADVLIEGSLIRAVQPGIEASDSTVIEASGMIVMPGFVDAHRHTWEGTLKQLAAKRSW
jgi:5-methylthioadenosine/S-adenosylhomocysteine deaminase